MGVGSSVSLERVQNRRGAMCRNGGSKFQKLESVNLCYDNRGASLNPEMEGKTKLTASSVLAGQGGGRGRGRSRVGPTT